MLVRIKKILRGIVRRFRPKKVGIPAVGNIEHIATVYDSVYATNEKYDTLDVSNEPKIRYMVDYAHSVDGAMLDAGCGRGNALRYLRSKKIDISGIELSTTCFQKYLLDLPVENIDIVTHAESGARYAGTICTDVMEHIPRDQIDETIAALAMISPSVLFGIANHSSIHNGHELHVIQEGMHWWKETLGRSFAELQVIEPALEDTVLVDHFKHERFFFIVATNQ